MKEAWTLEAILAINLNLSALSQLRIFNKLGNRHCLVSSVVLILFPTPESSASMLIEFRIF